MTHSTKEQVKGRYKGNKHKTTDLKPKENHKTSEGASVSKKNKKFEKKNCPYCMRGFHPEESCMKKTFEQLKALCVQNNIFLPQGVDMSENEDHTK